MFLLGIGENKYFCIVLKKLCSVTHDITTVKKTITILSLLIFSILSYAQITVPAQGLKITSGNNLPNGQVFGSAGDLFMSKVGNSGTLWQKVSGANTKTGWEQISLPSLNGVPSGYVLTDSSGKAVWQASGGGSSLESGNGITISDDTINLGGSLYAPVVIEQNENPVVIFDETGDLVRIFGIGNLSAIGQCDTCVVISGFNSFNCSNGSYSFLINDSSFSLTNSNYVISANSFTGAMYHSVTNDGITYGFSGNRAYLIPFSDTIVEHFNQIYVEDGVTASSISVNNSSIEKQAKFTTANSSTGLSSGLYSAESYIMTTINAHNQEYGRNLSLGSICILDSNGVYAKYQRGNMIFSIDTFGIVTPGKMDSVSIYAITPQGGEGSQVFCTNCTGNGITGRLLTWIGAAWRRLLFE